MSKSKEALAEEAANNPDFMDYGGDVYGWGYTSENAKDLFIAGWQAATKAMLELAKSNRKELFDIQVDDIERDGEFKMFVDVALLERWINGKEDKE